MKDPNRYRSPETISRPVVVDRYRELVQEIAKLDKERKSIYAEAKELAGEYDWDDFYLQSRTKTTWNDELILEWLCDNYPEYADECTAMSLDYEVFGKLVKLGKIDASQIPAEACTEEYSYDLRTTRRKNEDSDNH
jgi:hypothetical protein